MITIDWVTECIRPNNFFMTYVPCTMERSIGHSIVFRPIKSWHSLSYAGEKLTTAPNSDDHSGCVNDDGMCRAPLTVTHRVYWKDDEDDYISAFLSYPRGMAHYGKDGEEYFWEIYGPTRFEDVERYTSEKEMEERIIELFNDDYEIK